MAENKVFGIFLMSVIAVLVGLAFLQSLATQIAYSTIQQYENESVAISSGNGVATYDDIQSMTYFGNDTNSTVDSGISFGTEVNYTANGSIVVSQGTDKFANGNYNVVYYYNGDNYVNNSTARVFLTLCLLFFVIVITVTAAGTFKKMFPNI